MAAAHVQPLLVTTVWISNGSVSAVVTSTSARSVCGCGRTEDLSVAETPPPPQASGINKQDDVRSHSRDDLTQQNIGGRGGGE